jgi:hypothetical protein
MEAPSLISRGLIKSGPVAFVVSSNCRTSSMSVSVMCSWNKCNNLIRMAKNDYFSTISEKIIAESSGSKNWWNLDKRLLGSSKNRSRNSIICYI